MPADGPRRAAAGTVGVAKTAKWGVWRLYLDIPGHRWTKTPNRSDRPPLVPDGWRGRARCGLASVVQSRCWHPYRVSVVVAGGTLASMRRETSARQSLAEDVQTPRACGRTRAGCGAGGRARTCVRCAERGRPPPPRSADDRECRCWLALGAGRGRWLTPTPPFASIASLGKDYRRGALTPTAVTETCLARIERHDGPLNAIVPGLADEARADAARAGEELAAGHDRGPLHGIPIGIKDLVDIAGTVTGFGSDPVFAARAARDAAMIAHLRAAGAVLVAKTNLLEFAYGAVNPRVGQTNNPWDEARTAGGSSGGLGGGRRRRPLPCGRGHRYRRLDPHPRRLLRAWLGLKPNAWPRAALRRLDALVVSRSRRADGRGAAPMRQRCSAGFRARLSTRGRNRSAASVSASLRRSGTTTRPRPAVRAGMEDACAALRDAGAAVEECRDRGALGIGRGPASRAAAGGRGVILGHLLDEHPEALAEQTPRAAGARLALPATAHVRAQQFRRFLGQRFLDQLARYDVLLSPGRPHGRRRRRIRQSTARRATARCCAARPPTSAACRVSSSPAGGGRAACP